MARAVRLAISLCLVLAGGGAGSARADPAAGDTLARLQHAIAAAEKQDGAASPHLLPLLAGLARLRFEDGDLTAAAAAAQRGLTIAISAFGPGSPDAAAAMARLAEAELDQLHYLDAEPLLIVADTIVAEPGAAVSAQIPVLTGLARIALARGDLTLAQASAEHAVALRAKEPPPRSTEPLRVLGAVLAAEHKFADSERVLTRAVALDRAAHGEESPQIARSLSQLGNLYLHADRFRDALAPLEQAAAIDQSRLAPDHPFIADDFHDIGIADEGLKRFAAARRVLAAALRLLHRDSGTDGRRVALIELELAHVDRSEGDTQDASAAFRHARRILDTAANEERRRERQA